MHLPLTVVPSSSAREQELVAFSEFTEESSRGVDLVIVRLRTLSHS